MQEQPTIAVQFPVSSSQLSKDGAGSCQHIPNQKWIGTKLTALTLPPRKFICLPFANAAVEEAVACMAAPCVDVCTSLRQKIVMKQISAGGNYSQIFGLFSQYSREMMVQIPRVRSLNHSPEWQCPCFSRQWQLQTSRKVFRGCWCLWPLHIVLHACTKAKYTSARTRKSKADIYGFE